jgi:hypothetical protein
MREVINTQLNYLFVGDWDREHQVGVECDGNAVALRTVDCGLVLAQE